MIDGSPRSGTGPGASAFENKPLPRLEAGYEIGSSGSSTVNVQRPEL